MISSTHAPSFCHLKSQAILNPNLTDSYVQSTANKPPQDQSDQRIFSFAQSVSRKPSSRKKQLKQEHPPRIERDDNCHFALSVESNSSKIKIKRLHTTKHKKKSLDHHKYMDCTNQNNQINTPIKDTQKKSIYDKQYIFNDLSSIPSNHKKVYNHQLEAIAKKHSLVLSKRSAKKRISKPRPRSSLLNSPSRIKKIILTQFTHQINQVDLLQVKFSRLKKTWNDNIHLIQQFFPSEAKLTSFETLKKNPERDLRLHLNKLEYMTHLCLSRQRRSQKVSLYEMYCVFILSHCNHHRKSPQTNTDKLLGDYFKRFDASAGYKIHHTFRLKAIRNKEILFGEVVPGILTCASQEVRLNPYFGRLTTLKDSYCSVIRFSFYVDLYLLKLCFEEGVNSFVDDLRFLYYVWHCLRSREPMQHLTEIAELVDTRQNLDEFLEYCFRKVAGNVECQLIQKFELLVSDLEDIIFERQLLGCFGICTRVEYQPRNAGVE